MHLRTVVALIVAPVAVFAIPMGISPEIIQALDAGDVIPNEWIVTFPTEEQLVAEFNPQVKEKLRRQYERKLARLGQNPEVIEAFRRKGMDALLVRTESARPDLSGLIQEGAQVYPNKMIYQDAIQHQAPWNLARISSRGLNKTKDSYEYYDGAGEEVDVYVVDSGIEVKHPEFEGRARWGLSLFNSEKDHGGHGTHVAGIIGGKTYGVAKKANLIAVQVFGPEGGTSSFNVAIGLQFVIYEYRRLGRKSVVNMSLGGSKDPFLNLMTKKVIDEGIYVVVAAGNSNKNACDFSPASVPEAITVGASDNMDKRAKFSNYGECVDIFAPGVDIKSTIPGKKYAVYSGTSMASPHVAGAMAVVLSSKHYGFRSVKKGTDYLYSIMSHGKLKNLRSSPNSMLYISSTFSPEPPKAIKGPKGPKRKCSARECAFSTVAFDCDCMIEDEAYESMDEEMFDQSSAMEIDF